MDLTLQGVWKMRRGDLWELVRLHGQYIIPLPRLTFFFDRGYQTVDQGMDIKMVYLDFSKAVFFSIIFCTRLMKMGVLAILYSHLSGA